MSKTIDLVMGSRGSRLALAQSNEVKVHLERSHPHVNIDIEVIQTHGDLVVDRPFGEIHSKDIFTKEIDDALLENKVDFATHSLKDIPSLIPEGLILSAVTQCIDPRDAFVSLKYKTFEELPENSIIGTSSLRRIALIRKMRPDCSVKTLRGNIDTRLQKLEQEGFHGIVVACAGLIRLGLQNRISQYFNPIDFVPSIGQGYLGIVCREKDSFVRKILSTVNHERSYQIMRAVRLFMKLMEGGCRIPLGCYAEDQHNIVSLWAYVSSLDGAKEIRHRVQGDVSNLDYLAQLLASEMEKKGARRLLHFG